MKWLKFIGTGVVLMVLLRLVAIGFGWMNEQSDLDVLLGFLLICGAMFGTSFAMRWIWKRRSNESSKDAGTAGPTAGAV